MTINNKIGRDDISKQINIEADDITGFYISILKRYIDILKHHYQTVYIATCSVTSTPRV